MERARIAPYQVVLCMLIATAVALHFMGETTMLEAIGVASELPNRIGDYEGKDILFCQNPTCLRSETVDTSIRQSVCSTCGGRLDEWAVGEKLMLPDDTILLRKRYRSSAGETMHVSVVISGRQRTSIHRPQMCLTGQGLQIVRERNAEVIIHDKPPITIRVLDLTRRAASLASVASRGSSAYAYWFVGGTRETPSHWTRTFWTAYDSVILGVSRRWAYVSIMTSSQPGSDEHVERLSSFTAKLYPYIRNAEPERAGN